MLGKWDESDQRRYERLRDKARKAGFSEGNAAAEAARRVSLRRERTDLAGHRELENSGVAAPDAPLENQGRKALEMRAFQIGVKGYQGMSLRELVEAIRRHPEHDSPHTAGIHRNSEGR